jgi:hypothetical protein
MRSIDLSLVLETNERLMFAVMIDGKDVSLEDVVVSILKKNGEAYVTEGQGHFSVLTYDEGVRVREIAQQVLQSQLRQRGGLGLKRWLLDFFNM